MSIYKPIAATMSSVFRCITNLESATEVVEKEYEAVQAVRAEVDSELKKKGLGETEEKTLFHGTWIVGVLLV